MKDREAEMQQPPSRSRAGVRSSSAPRLQFTRARSYQVLRTAHLERARDFAPASVLYADRRYDFDSSLADQLDLHRCGPVGLIRILLANPLVALEINEPLQLSGLPRAALAVAAVRTADRVHRRRGELRTRIGAYAIENLDPFLLRPGRLRSRVRRAGESILSRWVSRRLDRIAYGTDGAEQLYRQRLGSQLSRTDAQVFSALPAPCDCPAAASVPGVTAEPAPTVPVAELVLYLGALHRRKGVLELLDAWPGVLAERPNARLVLVGKGELEEEVRSRTERMDQVELVIDPPRPEIHRWLRHARTLVLFSQPTSRWREQVGLPILEGLAHDCRIVASTQTGLADWLAGHGHQVLAPDASPGRLAAAISAALAPMTPGDVLAQLPEVDGRRAADDWLLHDQRSVPAGHLRSDQHAGPAAASR